MNRDDIIRMGNQACVEGSSYSYGAPSDEGPRFILTVNALERFAELVAAAELRRLHELNTELMKAYRKMYNSAAGYSNYCDDNANTRRCERDFEEAEAIFRAATAKEPK